MKVSLVQSSVEWLQPEQNRVAAEGWIAKCSGSDLVVFSEMFTTGFCMNPESCANNETLEWMVSMAKRYGVALAGSVAVEETRSYYNRLYVVGKDGPYKKYDKRHLFTFAGEQNGYRAGEERVVVEIEGVRILLLICYDIRFPVWIRNRGDYDMILCVANWPNSRRAAWDILLKARAIENLSYVCGVNIVGEDPTSIYSGGTAAIDYLGREVASVRDGEQGVVTFEVDMDALVAFRAKFPALDDADDFELR
ncbi:MAG: nitrilase-related carbon-nitrogen hydrolase [Rikenellaceae bacterium]